jgi:hypothetical protein
MTAAVEILNANERRQEFEQWVATQVRKRKITEDELKAILADFGVDIPSKVRPKDRVVIRSLIEAQVERNERVEVAITDAMWARVEAIQLTVQRSTQLGTYTEVNAKGLKDFWKVMVEMRENDPEDNNATFRECLWSSLDEVPHTLKSREIRFEAIIDLLKVAQYDALEEAWHLLTSLSQGDPLLDRIWAAIDSSPWHNWTCLETRYDSLRWRLATDDVNEDRYRELLRIADHARNCGHKKLFRTVTAVSGILENMQRDKKALQEAVDVPQTGRRTYRLGKLKLK